MVVMSLHELMRKVTMLMMMLKLGYHEGRDSLHDLDSCLKLSELGGTLGRSSPCSA